MKLVTYRTRDQEIACGAVLDGRIVNLDDWIATVSPGEASRARSLVTGAPLAGRGLLRWLQGGTAAYEALARHLDTLSARTGIAIDDVQLYAPVPNPGKIVAIGRNYADHAKETGVAPFEKPRIISKFASSVRGHRAAIERPPGIAKLDFEVELAVIIGEPAYRVSREQARRHIAGYMVLNDLSAREFQFDVNPAQTTYAKSGDGFAPMGPWLVTPDEIDDPCALDLTLHLNGEQMQHGNTRDLLFPVDVLIEYLSQYCVLEAGDVLATGTPSGIGAFRSPPRFLQPGDALRLEVAQVGVLEHTIV
ncbi:MULTISPECIES: fumarylacetoacetate hydrolase family protein [Paraburkholderia]|uniref:fumarylacetoacetate hydrolase family protein n=1 Tax=Paraburkholderia TaxID=1822464 RepID=UPI00224E5E44|nr:MULTISPECIES: fumarylacetoacetate hydrolase family protein [Paraburkholderia]MCX4160010.1 fumarylacetoacetate hydrolase family protein [Paraburkholderia megapolitana]MDN7155510.1 fumarylacetoacetate hydrolase family protein [Paraburkholderia sp. CHISQ3]MDQ6492554.1 fumarylacetoacetate hydrolase family protein [Paraburkholderia megapolitana]